MRVIFAAFAMFVVVTLAVLSVSVVKLRRELAKTRTDLAALRAAWIEDCDFLEAPNRNAILEPGTAAPSAGPRLAPVLLAAPSLPTPQASSPVPDDEPPVDPAVAKQRADERSAREQLLDQRDEQRSERIATAMELGSEDRQRFLDILTLARQERRIFSEQERLGEKSWVEIRPQMNALRENTEHALRELLGEERMKRFETLRGAERGLAASPPPPVHLQE